MKRAADNAEIEVWADWELLRQPKRLGLVRTVSVRTREVFSFEYDDEWLAQSSALPALDPALTFTRGPQYAPSGTDNFGVFLDSSPDRWGRVLMQRREAQLARKQKRAERRLTERDYLLGVFDGHRLGGLRYRIGEGRFLDDNAELASPPWTSLRDLEHASRRLESDNAERDPNYNEWLALLLAPGRLLGGARPKASVVDASGHLWLAKFPSERDLHDVGAWESIVHILASRAGIRTSDAKRQRFGSRHHTFLAKRFDRTSAGARIHFASAMTMLGRRDGEAGVSYLELANELNRHGAHATRDLEQLWLRMVFFACVSNVDDHLRNHGFLLERSGWTLAPAYDMNPVATAGGLSLNISETDNAQDLELLRSVAKHFRVNAKRASQVISNVIKAVQTWRTEAKRAKLSRTEQERMAPAFALAER